jgi:hypothetical protein
VLYIRATVTVRGGGSSRRWQSAIAIVAALSLFAVIITGWASRGSPVAGVAVPQPAALSQGTHTGVNVGHVQLGDRSHSTSYLGHGVSPTHQKPTKHAWMTRDRPPTWTRLSPQSVRSPLPASFATSGLQPSGGKAVAAAAGPADQDILAQLCVARR